MTKELRVWLNNAGQIEFTVTEEMDDGREVTYTGTGRLDNFELEPESPKEQMLGLDREWTGSTFQLDVAIAGIRNVFREVH